MHVLMRVIHLPLESEALLFKKKALPLIALNFEPSHLIGSPQFDYKIRY